MWNTRIRVTVLLVLLSSIGHGESKRSRSRQNDSVERGSCVCVRVNRLNARNNPSFGSSVVAVLSKGRCFTFSGNSWVTGRVTWWKIRASQNQDLWVSSRYLRLASNSERCGRMEPCPGVNTVSRDEWHARAPKQINQMPVPVGLVFIHHTAMDPCDSLPSCSAEMRKIQNFHMDDRGWDDIGYNFLVGGDGRVYIGRGWDRVGAHTYGYNNKSVAISFMGNYMLTPPTQPMLTAAQNLIQCGIDQGYISGDYSLHGHRDVRCTDCPGDVLYGIIGTWPHWHREVLPSPVCGPT